MPGGGCLCGAVRYNFTGDFLWTAHCHCESCRRQTASPMTTFFSIEKAKFDYVGAPPGRYVSSPGVVRSFCAKCGTPIAYEYDEKPGEIHLYAVGLDDSSDIAPERHDFWNERVKWLSIRDDLPKHEA